MVRWHCNQQVMELKLNMVNALAAGISCGHAVVVPCHEKAAANAFAVEVLVHAVGSGMEAGVASGVLGVTTMSGEEVVVSGGQGVENVAVARSEQVAAVEHGEHGVGNEAAVHSELGVGVNGE